ncbi:MAG: DoxX family protein [Pyrinomonadaceae bacterium]
MLKKILFGGESGLSPFANAGLTLLRIFAGAALALTHGIGKMPPSDGFIEGTARIGFPLPAVFAWAAAFSEFLGGIFLALGLFTRVSSFFIAITMLVALLGVHRADPFQKQELAFLYFFIALAFMLKGSGDWSIDSFLRK